MYLNLIPRPACSAGSLKFEPFFRMRVTSHQLVLPATEFAAKKYLQSHQCECDRFALVIDHEYAEIPKEILSQDAIALGPYSLVQVGQINYDNGLTNRKALITTQ